MKNFVIFFWAGLSCIYILGGLGSSAFLGLRLNLWIQINLTAFILASCGAVLQNILRNPIADPWILGVSGASTLSAVAASLLKLAPILFWRTAASLGGGLLAIVFLMNISRRDNKTDTAKFILIGMGVNSFCSSMIIFLQSLAGPNNFAASMIRIAGHFSERGAAEIAMLFAAAVIMILFFNRRKKELKKIR